MKLKGMFKKTCYEPQKSTSGHGTANQKPEVPDGLLKKCNICKAAIFSEEVKNGHYICPKCHGYFRMDAYRRIEMIVDAGSFEEWDKGIASRNPLHYKGYEEKLDTLREKTGLDEAVITGEAKICGSRAVIGVCDGRFLMASMGRVVGEKITRAVERAVEKRLPVILFACSGGARMQEGIVSLMQMVKTSAALKRHSEAGLLFISVLTDPTTGGVTASFAMLGDVILAEPNALIGFAGPRVIEQTIGQKLPKGFQRSEFLLEHGFLDAIVGREEEREVLSGLLKLHEPSERQGCEKDEAERAAYSVKEIDAWERVQISRQKDRPVGRDYIDGLFTDFVELHGDRYYKDDTAVIGGIAKFHGRPVTVIAQAKGRDVKENVKRNFGMPSPEGYRKALRLMKQAEKFNRPVFCFVDTPGAFCGLEAEERGQGEAIARNLFEMSDLKVPVLSVVIGEGGSGGALAMAVADEVWMLENAVYSILSPEGFAAILWKDSKRAREAAGIMKLTSGDLKKLGIIEKIIPEPEVLTINNFKELTRELEYRMDEFLDRYESVDKETLTARRYERFRAM